MSAAIVPHPYPENPGKLLDYHPDTGEIFWKQSSEKNASWNARFANKPAGVIINLKKSNTLYRYISLSGKTYPAHRIIWMIYYGVIPSGVIDHINGNGLDNRIDNLRCVTRSVNSKNAKLSSNNRSGVSGVSWHEQSRKWVVRVHCDTVTKHVGEFSDFFEAVCARKSLELVNEYHANHGRKYSKPEVPEKIKHIQINKDCLVNNPEPCFIPVNIEEDLAMPASISPGAALQALRRVRCLSCAHCGASFTAKDPRATYCSNRCRQAAKYQKVKDRRAAQKAKP